MEYTTLRTIKVGNDYVAPGNVVALPDDEAKILVEDGAVELHDANAVDQEDDESEDSDESTTGDDQEDAADNKAPEVPADDSPLEPPAPAGDPESGSDGKQPTAEEIDKTLASLDEPKTQSTDTPAK